MQIGSLAQPRRLGKLPEPTIEAMVLAQIWQALLLWCAGGAVAEAGDAGGDPDLDVEALARRCLVV
jgi:hypothetical protein